MECCEVTLSAIEIRLNKKEAEVLMDILTHVEIPVGLDSTVRDFKTNLHFNLKTFVKNLKEQHE